jgi:hypothetical protein
MRADHASTRATIGMAGLAASTLLLALASLASGRPHALVGSASLAQEAATLRSTAVNGLPRRGDQEHDSRGHSRAAPPFRSLAEE